MGVTGSVDTRLCGATCFAVVVVVVVGRVAQPPSESRDLRSVPRRVAQDDAAQSVVPVSARPSAAAQV